MMTHGSAGRNVFLCYATKDQDPDRWLERLKEQLEPLMRRFNFELWDDSQVEPGTPWQREIEASLLRARAAVLLVGPAFLASEFITEIELPLLLQRAEQEGIPLLILLTQHCNFNGSDLAKFQAFREKNRSLEPLESLATAEQNRILQAFSVAIARAVEKHPEQHHAKQGVRHNVPAKPTNVVGRDRVLKKLAAALLEEDKPVILASGFGGVGKSTVAKVIVWKFVDQQQPFKFIAWVDVRQYSQDENAKPITFASVLDRIATAASSVSEIIGIGDIEVKTARVRELLSSTHSLLILDNYESLLENAEEEARVARFIDSLPISASGEDQNPFIRVLITTRIVSPALTALPIHDERLASLPFKDSLKMMTSRDGTPKLPRRQWKRVWEVLHGLPKYMQVAVEQLKSMAFADWEHKVTEFHWDPDNADDLFNNLFDFSWHNPVIISRDQKHILLAMTYFVGHALPEQLCRTSGLDRGRFGRALSVASNARYVEVDRKRGRAEYYTLHSLMHAYCRAALTTEEFRAFREKSSVNFVKGYLEFARNATNDAARNLFDDESGNITAAARVARRVEAWKALIGFREYASSFFRQLGNWDGYREVVEFAADAYRVLGDEVSLAECLVYDLAWYYSRLEQVDMARQFIEEGLVLFRKHNHRPGMAQAERHLGKAALLDGLDIFYRPIRGAEKDFRSAEDHYHKSLEIRQHCQCKANGQRLAIADMKLDFGRLYWLQGMWLQRKGKYDEAREKYKEADHVSEEARLEYEQMSLDAGTAQARVAKVWGNRGNAAKEMASLLAETRQWAGASEHAELAVQCYGLNLSLGQKVSKKDEIAHALAGLGEVRVLMSRWPNAVVQAYKKPSLLRYARKVAKRSHRLYEELAGPSAKMGTGSGSSQMKTRDEMRTQYLIDEIDRLLGELDSDVEPRAKSVQNKGSGTLNGGAT